MIEDNVGFRNPLLPFMAGALLGAGIALVLAPQSGILTRKMLSKRASRLTDKAIERSRAAKAILDSAVEKGKNTLDMAQAWGREVYKTGQEILQTRSNVGGERSTAPRSEVTGNL